MSSSGVNQYSGDYHFLTTGGIMGSGEAPVPGVIPPGGELVIPPCPAPGVGPEGAAAARGTPGWGDEPVPG